MFSNSKVATSIAPAKRVSAVRSPYAARVDERP